MAEVILKNASLFEQKNELEGLILAQEAKMSSLPRDGESGNDLVTSSLVLAIEKAFGYTDQYRLGPAEYLLQYYQYLLSEVENLIRLEIQEELNMIPKQLRTNDRMALMDTFGAPFTPLDEPVLMSYVQEGVLVFAATPKEGEAVPLFTLDSDLKEFIFITFFEQGVLTRYCYGRDDSKVLSQADLIIIMSAVLVGRVDKQESEKILIAASLGLSHQDVMGTYDTDEVETMIASRLKKIWGR